MTTDKAFKRVVRARMAKTGERYAAARRTLVEGATDGHHAEPTADAATPSGYRMRGGLHPETATLANVLANQGVVSGVTGEPLTEAAILGIGGGLGAGYILWEFKSHGGPVLTLGFRNQPQYPSIPGWTGKTLDRLGIEPDLHETGGARGAREALDARLEAGVPVIAWVDLQSIGTWGQPEDLSGHFGLVVVVFGRDADGSYLVDDRGLTPFRVSPAVMAAARGRIGSFKHRIVGLRTTPGPIPAERLQAAMRAGLEDQVDHLRSPSDSFSLPAWRKWGRLMTDERNAKAWPRVFADGHGLFGSLSAIHESVDGQVGPVVPEPDEELAEAPTGLQMSIEEMSAATGIDRDRIRDLESYGLVKERGPEGARYFDGDDYIVLSIVKDFFRFGIEPRHLTMYKHFEEREAAFFETIVMPQLRQRNPDARRNATASLTELARASRKLKQALLRTNLRQHLT